MLEPGSLFRPYHIVSILFLVTLLLPLFLPVLVPVAHAQTENNVFADNFEGYQVGTFPSAGGWEIVWDGMGQSYQVISTSYSYSPTRSFQLWGRTGWSSVVQKRFSADSPIIGYELSILIDERSSGYTDHPAFFCKDCATWGAYYGTVNFDHGDGKIKAEDGTVLGSWSPRTWYRVKVVLDRQTNKYSVWINGELRGQNIPTSRSDTNRINAIALVSGWPGKKVYYDDVRVFIVVQQQSYLRVRLDSATLNGQGLSTGNPELRVNPDSRITGTVTITVENVQPGSWITPVIWVTSWERGTVSNGRVRVIANDIRSTRQFTVNIDVTAPSSPGTYYIGFFAGWMYNADEVASNDHPPNYGDGDDVWDMPAQGWEEVISNGQASTGPYRMPGRAIRIIVQQQQTTIVDVWTNKGGRGVGNLDGGQYTVGESITLYCETAGATLLRMVLIRPDGSSVEVLKLSNVQAGTYSVSGTVGEPTGVWIASCIEQHGERDPVALLWDDVRFTVQRRATATVTVYTTTTRTVTSTLHATATTETTTYITVYQTTYSTSTRTWYTTVTKVVTTTVTSWTTVTTTVLG